MVLCRQSVSIDVYVLYQLIIVIFKCYSVHNTALSEFSYQFLCVLLKLIATAALTGNKAKITQVC